MGLLQKTLRYTGCPLADVAVYAVQRRTGERHKKPYIVRWRVNARSFSRSYCTKAEAERLRTALLVAAQSGESFDDTTGEPLSWQPLPDQTQTHHWARNWLAEQWPDWAPRTRVSAVEALTRLVPLLVAAEAQPPPASLPGHLFAWLPPDGTVIDEDADA